MIYLHPFDQHTYCKNKAATKGRRFILDLIQTYLTVILRLMLQKVFALAFKVQVVL